MADKQSVWQENENYLRGMANMAKKRLGFLQRYRDQRKEDWYVRIAGDSYRAVSVDNETPLMGYAKRGTKNEDTLLKDFKEGTPKVPTKKVPERHAQCWLIKQAMKNSQDMKQVLLPGNNSYERLLFGLDEVSLLNESNGKERVRCDILAVGIRNEEAFPVLIELKWAHHLSELVRQLNRFCKIIGNHQEAFKELLRNCFGEQVSIPHINTNHIEKMVIWNEKGKVRGDTIKTLQANKIRLLQYKYESDSVKEIKELEVSKHHAARL